MYFSNLSKVTMELLPNSSQNDNDENSDSSKKALLQHTTSQCANSLQPKPHSRALAFHSSLTIEGTQHQPDKPLTLWPSENSASIKEMCKITGIVLKIVILSLLINMIITSCFGSPRNDEGSETKIETSSQIWEETTLPNNEKNFTQMVSENATMHLSKVIQASSLNEYKAKISGIPTSVSISLRIIADQPSDLATFANLPLSEKVTEITIEGCLEPHLFYQLLMQLTNVSKITIIEYSRNKCNYKNIFIKQGPKVTFKNLTSIKFENITSGNSIYSIFSNQFLMMGVSTLEFSQTEITEENIAAMRKLLEQVRYSLRILLFPNVQWNHVLFQNFLCVFPNLVELRLDFLTRIDSTDNFLGTLNKNAPNLKRFVSKHGYLKFSKLSSITLLQNVESLSFGLQVPAKLDYMDITFLTRYLPLLTFMELSLRFDNPSNCKVLESDVVKRKHSISYFTECDLNILTS